MDVPVALPERMQPELVGDVRRAHRIGEVLSKSAGVSCTNNATLTIQKTNEKQWLEVDLLVGEYQQNSILQFILAKHLVQLVPCLRHPIPIVAVNNEDQRLRVHEVVAPQRADLVLASNVPHCEVDILVFDCFDVEAYGRNGRDVFAELKLVQDSGFTGRVQADHEYADIFLSADKAFEDAGEITHCKW